MVAALVKFIDAGVCYALADISSTVIMISVAHMM